MNRAHTPSTRVLITGGASGLGAALAARYRDRGARVVTADIATPHTAPSPHLRLDVTDEADWSAALHWVQREWGGLDLLINNAGIASGGRIDHVDNQEWRRMFDINVLGAVNGCRAVTPLFKLQRSGHVVNIASLAGLVHPAAMSPYAAGKAAVVALSESLRYELAPWGIDVSVVCPSFFRSNLSTSISGTDKLAAQIAVKLVERAPVSADDIAARVIEAVDRKQFLVLPDRRARMAYWAKKLARPLYDRQMNNSGAAIAEAGSDADLLVQEPSDERR